jgi:DNA-binding NarL/FixJ family response regulator
VIEVSAHDLCTSHDCTTPDCDQTADPGSDLCHTCAQGSGTAAIHRAINEPSRYEGPTTRLAWGELSPMELLVLRCAADGLTIPETALRVKKVRDTVKSHRHQLMDKLAAKTITHAVAIAYRRGLLQ